MSFKRFELFRTFTQLPKSQLKYLSMFNITCKRDEPTHIHVGTFHVPLCIHFHMNELRNVCFFSAFFFNKRISEKERTQQNGTVFREIGMKTAKRFIVLSLPLKSYTYARGSQFGPAVFGVILSLI